MTSDRHPESDDYAPMTPAELLEQAATKVIEAQTRLIERLTAENRELRAKLAVLR